MNKIICLYYLLVAGMSIFLGGAARAQEYPNKLVRLIIGFPPGGANDILGRYIAPKMAERLGVSVVVENRPGANAITGTDFVAKSAPDGYTLGLAGVSPLVITAFTYAKVPYDSVNDLVGISTVVMTPQLMVVHPSLPANSLRALIALAKAQPGKMDFATAGSGGTTRMAVELFKLTAGVNVQVVAYKGAAQGITELLGGHVQGMVMDLPVLLPHVKGGKLRGVVNTGERRSALLPDVATAAEQGMPALQAVNWYAVVVSAKTPRTIVDKLHGVVTSAVQAPDLKTRLSNDGFEPMTSSSPEAYAAFHKQEFARWGKVAKAAGVKAE
jgi:tripartite-type tricarboxylate transporter receptor subunit TctC